MVKSWVWSRLLTREPVSRWVSHPDFPMYEVSDDGEVRRDGRLLGTVRSGYRSVYLPGCRSKRKIAVMVLETFVGPRPEGHLARHLNDDKLDDRLINLAWGTKPQNERDKVLNGKHANAIKTHCKNGHEFTIENTVIRKSGSRSCAICSRISRSKWAKENYKPKERTDELRAYQAAWARQDRLRKRAS